MKTFLMIIALAIGLESILGSLAYASFNPDGIIGPVAHVTWNFHMIGYLLAQNIGNTNAVQWSIIVGIGFLQSLAFVALLVFISTRRRTA